MIAFDFRNPARFHAGSDKVESANFIFAFHGRHALPHVSVSARPMSAKVIQNICKADR